MSPNGKFIIFLLKREVCLHWTPDREVRVRALARSLCSVLGQDTLLSRCLSPPRSKWVPATCQGNLTKCWGGNLRWTSIPSRRSSNTSSRLMLRKLGKAPPGLCGPLGSCADFTLSWRKLLSVYVKIAMFFKGDIWVLSIFIVVYIELFQQL